MLPAKYFLLIFNAYRWIESNVFPFNGCRKFGFSPKHYITRIPLQSWNEVMNVGSFERRKFLRHLFLFFVIICKILKTFLDTLVKEFLPSFKPKQKPRWSTALKVWVKYKIKGCLSLFNYFIDMSPTLMSQFFVEKTCFWNISKTCFFDKKLTH